jgi:hypothetical protein
LGLGILLDENFSSVSAAAGGDYHRDDFTIGSFKVAVEARGLVGFDECAQKSFDGG